MPMPRIPATGSDTEPIKSCDTQISSWHGMRIAGILGALTNNSRGVAGITWSRGFYPFVYWANAVGSTRTFSRE